MSDANDLGRQSRRRKATRQRLLAAALVVFEREGLADATIASITEEADVGFGTFYLYFETKEALFESVVREGFQELVQQLQEAIQQAGARSDDWREMIQRCVATYFQFAAGHRSLYRVMFAGREAGIGLRRWWREPLAQQLTNWIRAAQQQGQIFTGYTPEIVAISLAAALNRSGFWWMQQQEMASADTPSQSDVVTTMSRFIIAVLEGPSTL
jgi:AcrR family transcriptional regulator